MTHTSDQVAVSNSINELGSHIAALCNLPETDSPVVSAYFDLRQPLQKLLAELETWSVAARITLPRSMRDRFDEAKAQIRVTLNQPWQESAQGLAIFARSGDQPLLKIMPFQATLDNHFDASARAAIFPLVQLKDRFHRFILVICTEDSGRILELTLGTVTSEILTSRPDHSNRLGRQLSREHFHHRREEDTRQMVREQVQIIGNLMSRRGFNHLVLAGHPRHISPLRDQLPKSIQSRIVGSVFQSPQGQDYSPLLDQAIDAFIQAEQKESRSAVERLNEQIRRNGLATVGIHRCRVVITSGAASHLIIAEELPFQDREELVHLATLHNVPIEVCEGDELLESYGHVGCLLRYHTDFMSSASRIQIA